LGSTSQLIGQAAQEISNGKDTFSQLKNHALSIYSYIHEEAEKFRDDALATQTYFELWNVTDYDPEDINGDYFLSALNSFETSV